HGERRGERTDEVDVVVRPVDGHAAARRRALRRRAARPFRRAERTAGAAGHVEDERPIAAGAARVLSAHAARAVAADGALLGERAGRARAAAVDVGLAAVLQAVAAARRLADAAAADAARAVARGVAGLAVGAAHAERRRSAAVDPALAAVLDAVGAVRDAAEAVLADTARALGAARAGRLANAARAAAGRAVRAEEALLAGRAARTAAAATIDVGLGAVRDAVGARRCLTGAVEADAARAHRAVDAVGRQIGEDRVVRSRARHLDARQREAEEGR